MYSNCISQYSSGTAATSVDYEGRIIFAPLADNSGPDLQPAFVYGPGLPILWAAAGSHLTILVVTLSAAILFSWFILAVFTAQGVEGVTSVV